MRLFRKKSQYIKIKPTKEANLKQQRARVPDGLAQRCPACKAIIFRNSISQDYLCPKCEEHLQFPAKKRIHWLVDDGTFQEWDAELTAMDPLNFPDYKNKIKNSQKITGLEEAIITGAAQLEGQPFAIGVMDNRFIMASMGTIVGEKLTRLFETATEQKLPVILYVASGGARMQEGILSLMQMAKVTQAISVHSEAGLFYCPFLTHPTTGGVTASFAMQGDITLAEPKATVGFAGRRVIEQTMQSALPSNFQAAETVLANGFIDKIVPRAKQRDTINLLLSVHQIESQGD